uniref:Uncharacterized protein n=1 Tax=Acrobeloides nanus TaxID=290746 RepID=A0A914BZ38_9BILA
MQSYFCSSEEDKNIELSETSLKLLEERANVLSLVKAVRKQEDENDTMKKAYEEKLKESEYNLKKLQENHANLNIQMNTLKSKWRGEARRIFHESMAYVQKNYKQMLAVEELGFLKPSEDFTPLKISMNPSESVISITTSSSSYEKINDLSESQMHVLENVEKNDGTNK